MNCRVFFGHVEIRDLPPRVEGRDLILRSEHVSFDGRGNVEKRFVFEGARVENGALHRHLFWP